MLWDRLVTLLATLLALGVAIANSVKKGLPDWFLWVPVSLIAVSLLFYAGPPLYHFAARARRTWNQRRTANKHWPEFIHLAKELTGYLDPDLSESLYAVILEGIQHAKDSQRQMLQDRLKEVSLLGVQARFLLNRLRQRRSRREPHTIKSFATELETLVDALRQFECFQALRVIESNACPQSLAARLGKLKGDFDHWLRQYASMAKKANAGIGIEVFQEYLPLLRTLHETWSINTSTNP